MREEREGIVGTAVLVASRKDMYTSTPAYAVAMSVLTSVPNRSIDQLTNLFHPYS
jgi:hypothetical protein